MHGQQLSDNAVATCRATSHQLSVAALRRLSPHRRRCTTRRSFIPLAGKEAAPVQRIHAGATSGLGNAQWTCAMSVAVSCPAHSGTGTAAPRFLFGELVSSGRILKGQLGQLFHLGRILQKIILPSGAFHGLLPNASIISMVLQFVNTINYLFVNTLGESKRLSP